MKAWAALPYNPMQDVSPAQGKETHPCVIRKRDAAEKKAVQILLLPAER